MSLFSFRRKSRPKLSLPTELDLPPMPPPLAEGEDELPALSSLDEDIPAPPEEEELMKFSKKEKIKLPEFLKMPPMPSEEPLSGEDEFGLPEFPKLVSEKEEELPVSIEPEKRGFMRIGALRDILEDINSAQSSLKETKNSLLLVDTAEDDKDKMLERWRKNIEDLNKKIMLMDKILFKG